VIGKVKIQKTGWTGARDRWVAVFGGGMSGDDVANSLIVLDIDTGTPLKIFTAGIDNNMIPSPTMLLDPNGYIKFIYLADQNGSLYKFDLRSTGLESDGYAAWGVNKIFQASSSQPVFHRAEPGVVTENLRYLFFGTGNQEAPVSELGAAGTGKFYAIKDTDSYWPASPLTEANLADLTGNLTTGNAPPTDNGWLINLYTVPQNANGAGNYTHDGEKVLSDPVIFYNNVYFTTFTPNASDPCGGGGIARVYGVNMINATEGMAVLASKGESSASGKVAYHVYTGNPEGGIPSSPSLSVYPSGQSSIFIGFSTGAVKEIQIESPGQMKNIKSWKETF
jgi:Tfp pilus tip-associated adhesin PilY1